MKLENLLNEKKAPAMIILFATDQLQVREIAETQIREKLIFFNSVFFRFDAIPNFFEIRFDG